MRTIVVTGCAGFIGSNFCRRWEAAYPADTILGIDKFTYAADEKNLEGLKRLNLVREDIGSDKIRSILQVENPTFIFNFAANSHVDNSIKDRMPFVKDNVLSTVAFLDSCLDVYSNMSKIQQERFLFVHVSCYDEKTNVLTRNGIKNYKQVTEDDEVLTLNPETTHIEWKKVEKVIVQDYEGEMISYKNSLVDMKVTPNHRMYYFSGDKRALQISKAEEIEDRTAIYLPIGKWQGEDVRDLEIENIGRINAEDLFYLIGVYLGDGCIKNQEKERLLKSGLNKEDYMKQRDEKGRFISVKAKEEKIGICHSYRLWFYVPREKKGRKRLEEVLNRIGIKWTEHKGGGSIYINKSKSWVDFFTKFGVGFANKHIPTEYLQYSKRLLHKLYLGLIDTDGSYQKDMQEPKCIFTSSEILKRDIVELMVKLGIHPRVGSRMSESEIDGRKIIPTVPNYRIASRTCRLGIGKEVSKRKEYKGKIWCLKVADNRNMLVERNGVFAFSGNTDEVYGALKIDEAPFTEDSRYKPNSVYSASKAASDHFVRAYKHTHGLPVAITHCSNNYGPRQHKEKLIPKVIDCCLKDKPIPVYGKGEQVRDWIHVSDHCDAIEYVANAVLKNETEKRVFNIGSQEEIKNIELITFIADVMTKETGRDCRKLITFVDDRLGHDFRYAIDPTLMRQIGWKPEKKFADAMLKTIYWYLERDLR